MHNCTYGDEEMHRGETWIEGRGRRIAGGKEGEDRDREEGKEVGGGGAGARVVPTLRQITAEAAVGIII